MNLAEAFDLSRRQSTGKPSFPVTLACGFTPLHLGTFLTAYLAAAVPAKSVELRTGLFGDLAGTLEQLPENTEAVAVALEWADLDPRLGYRSLGGWGAAQQPEYAPTVAFALDRLWRSIERIPPSIPVAIAPPSLPMAPAFHTASGQAGVCELRIRNSVAAFLTKVAQRPSVAVVNESRLLTHSPLSLRCDLRADVLSGFPYTVAHSSALAESLAALIRPQAAKKGLITDLDNTLWYGAAGEAGPAAVRWDLSGHGHMHGLYQQLLRALAEQGVLIAAASKNDRPPVNAVFARPDLVLPPQAVFPVEANWQPKSKSIGRILETWNVGPESVVFVDDSPMEIAEVKAAWPAMECLLFPAQDEPATLALLRQLRDLCAKKEATIEDTLRAASIRRAAEMKQPPFSSEETFLEQAQAAIVAQFDPPVSEARTLELVNKTNQFNLNGIRYSAAEWLSQVSRPGGFALIVSYQDRFGPLGRIAVLKGVRTGRALEVTTWVMSCRAFSRRIEHQCLKILFDHFQVDEIRLNFLPTARNRLLGEILQTYHGVAPTAPISLSLRVFRERMPALYHKVELNHPMPGAEPAAQTVSAPLEPPG